MTSPFGDTPVALSVSSVPRSGGDDQRRVTGLLADLGSDGGTLDIVPPLSTAAFSRRDTLLPGYAAAVESVRRHGFAPMTRPVGGHLAAYDQGSLVLHLAVPHPEPRTHIQERFALFGDAVAGAFRGLGVDARVGPVPGEYCDGKYSVNDSGRAKLVGTGQRIVRAGYLFSALVMVASPQAPRAALTDAYADLGLGFRPESVGCVADSLLGVTSAEVCELLVDVLAGLLPLRDGVPTPACARGRPKA